ncbi:glycosyltransferase family 4 protein [Sediminibacterium soli]|uniref:glycosyltransferase family 4 protein n=1 Tax=Sediminibacterium soli TaxID=2698829 RepID=UPI00137B9292|nr:glycosyltransferase family 4 protein [Sediminibacterium soli]NCI48052.1 glycosyltransferase family 4 protein [Sediminibacterium soli]
MRILVLGQTPPPYGGQSINIKKMLDAMAHAGVGHRFVRLNFSDEIQDMGSFSLKKMARLAGIFLRLLWNLLVYRPSFVYYPPAGPLMTPVLRDIVLLFPVRLFGVKRIFHFHAGGVSHIYARCNPVLKALYRFAYYRAEHSICLSEYGRKDAIALQSRAIHIIPSGVADIGTHPSTITGHQPFCVLFMGLCSESKGILDFIDTIRLARQDHPGITGKILGAVFSEKEKRAIEAAVAEGIIRYEGVQTGPAKIGHIREAQALLFPSFFESENFPTVILEAFSAGLPVVATRWRGIRDQVHPAKNGFLHEVHDTKGMAASLVRLARDPQLYTGLSANARHDFETYYTLNNFDAAIVNFYKSTE